MNTINERIAQCIATTGLTKTAFAQKIGLTQAYVSALSTGRKVPSDRTIADICREFNVNEAWLRSGEGEMFRRTPDTLADKLAQEYGLDDLGRQIMAAYLNLDEKDRQAVGRLIQNIIDERPVPAPASPHEAQNLDIEAQVEEYRQHLLLEQEESQASSVSDTAAG